MQTSREMHKNKLLLMHTPSATPTNTPTWLRVVNGTESAAQRFTSEGSLAEALLDAVGSAHMKGLGDLLVHETLSVEDVCHHHPQVEHLQQLCDGGDLHQISSALVQTARVQVLKHRLEPVNSGLTLDTVLIRIYHLGQSQINESCLLSDFREIVFGLMLQVISN